jgi:hypothetical protein
MGFGETSDSWYNKDNEIISTWKIMEEGNKK